MLNRVAPALPLSVALLLALAAPALAQPAVPAVGPAPARPAPSASSASDLPPTSAPTSAPIATAPAPVASAPRQAAPRADDPPTTDFAPAPTTAPVPVTTAAAPPRPAAAPAVGAVPPSATDAAPTSAPAQAASAAGNTPPAAAAAEPPAPTPETVQTVARNAPLTPEGNAAFLASYKARPDVISLPSGVMYRPLVTGKGTTTPISRLDTITISYRGWLIDGTPVDSSVPGVPRSFQIGSLIEGWREAVLKMKVGDLWELVIPASLAYGAEGRAGRIPPNQTLVFVVSMAKIEYAG